MPAQVGKRDGPVIKGEVVHRYGPRSGRQGRRRVRGRGLCGEGFPEPVEIERAILFDADNAGAARDPHFAHVQVTLAQIEIQRLEGQPRQGGHDIAVIQVFEL